MVSFNETTEDEIWLSNNYLETILRNYKNDQTIQIHEIKFSSVTAKGESYGGIITRAIIIYKSDNKNNPESINFVIKSSLKDDKFATDTLRDFDVFNTEMKIYKEILPNLKKILEKFNLDEFLFAEPIYIDFNNFIIIFEDLRGKNFITANRLNGLDMKHAKISLQKLAKLHSAAAILHRQQPELFTTFNKGFFTRQTDSYTNLYQSLLKTCSEVINEDFDENYQIYGKKLKILESHLMELGRKCFDPSSDQFNTLVHGDIWTTNLMFQYSAETRDLLNAVLIDFQFSCWSSIAIDLQYFFNIALEENVKRNHMEDLLKYYHDMFSYNLIKMNYCEKIPTLNEFYINYLKKDFYGFVVTCVHQPIALNEASGIDFQVCHGIDERAFKIKKLMYKNKKIQDNLKYWLPIFDRKGLLDMKS